MGDVAHFKRCPACSHAIRLDVNSDFDPYHATCRALLLRQTVMEEVERARAAQNRARRLLDQAGRVLEDVRQGDAEFFAPIMRP